ncbi:MAG: LysR family transcriptional regulator [Lachnospiraceae bacterium]|nr:LysR family transcriptional regulator [Lachnospiraceae bacterium]
MEITQLKYFYVLAQNQHVTRTAEQLNIAQPSLTQSIRRLEKELNVKLFKTNGRNIVLTEYGKYLQRKIEPLLKTLNEIPEEIQTLTGDRKKMLKINVLAASTLITDTIIRYQKEHPEVRFQIVQNVETEDADITIFTREFFQQPLVSKDSFYIFSEEIFLAVPKTSEYAQRETITLNEMAGKSFISLAGTKGLRSICDRFCLHAGFKPNVVFESDNASAVKNLIGASIGVGFWPEHTWETHEGSGMTLLPISEPKCQRDIIVQLHHDSESHEEAFRYYKYLVEFFEELKKA